MNDQHANPPFLQIRHITKQYPGVLAVDDVTLGIEAGTIRNNFV